MYRHLLSLTIFLALAFQAGAVSVTATCSDPSRPPVKVEVAKSTGLDGGVIVFPALPGATLTSDAGAATVWKRFSNLGAAYAEPMATGSALTALADGCGYVAEAPDGTACYVWVIDYSAHPCQLQGFTLSPADSDCDRVAFNLEGSVPEMVYYTINGRRGTLDREVKLRYTTQTPPETDDEAATPFEYTTTEAEVSFEYLHNPFYTTGSLCRTDYELEGDRFLRSWGEPASATAAGVSPIGVSAVTRAAESHAAGDNEVVNSAPGGAMGGSAPCEVTFEAAVSEGAIFSEWEISDREDFDDVDLRISELTFTRIFTEEGSVYVRFICANADGTCRYEGAPYTISIGASMLKCPNAFSPGNGDGVNDIWKVTYSSLISFQCSIFDRRGRKMCSFSDPSQGWDGKYGGKLVPAGVYYYVIKAVGSDGRKYDLSGDINIVNYK